MSTIPSLVVMLAGSVLILVACHQQPGKLSAKFIAAGGLIILVIGTALLVDCVEQDRRTRRQQKQYDQLRTEVPDKTNWGAFDIYPEKED